MDIKNNILHFAQAKHRVIKRRIIKNFRWIIETLGYNLSKKSDFYSPLPTESSIEKNLFRWYKPSSLGGVRYSLDEMKKSLNKLISGYLSEFKSLPAYDVNKSMGFGPGYTEVDACVLFTMIRNIKPQRYMEIGGGLSTFYASMAAEKNLSENKLMRIKCVEPFPFKKLYAIPNIEIIKDEVQNIQLDSFTELKENDVLFIDSSHVVKIDGDVPFLLLEVLPKLNKGVIVHIHDIPFPYNVPYPSEQWVLGETSTAPYWPMYWNEAMLLQAFLAFNNAYDIVMSVPIIRYFDEDFLYKSMPFYKPVIKDSNPCSSIWLKKIQ